MSGTDAQADGPQIPSQAGRTGASSPEAAGASSFVPAADRPLIAVIVPVLGRPQNALPLARSLAEATTLPYRLVFVCSVDDDEQLAACTAALLDMPAPEPSSPLFPTTHGLQATCRATVSSSALDTPPNLLLSIHDPPPRRASWARKVNHAYRLTDERYLLLAADDLRFHPGWDTAVIEIAERTGLGVIGTNDLGNATVMAGKASTHPLVARWYADAYGTVDGPGQVVSEAYAHNWVDAELCETAKARGMWAFAGESHVEHLHPFWGKGADDAVYASGRERYHADARLFRIRRRQFAKARVTA